MRQELIWISLKKKLAKRLGDFEKFLNEKNLFDLAVLGGVVLAGFLFLFFASVIIEAVSRCVTGGCW